MTVTLTTMEVTWRMEHSRFFFPCKWIMRYEKLLHVIAIPQAGIAAPTPTVTQGFEAKKRLIRLTPSLILCTVSTLRILLSMHLQLWRESKPGTIIGSSVSISAKKCEIFSGIFAPKFCEFRSFFSCQKPAFLFPAKKRRQLRFTAPRSGLWYVAQSAEKTCRTQAKDLFLFCFGD